MFYVNGETANIAPENVKIKLLTNNLLINTNHGVGNKTNEHCNMLAYSAFCMSRRLSDF